MAVTGAAAVIGGYLSSEAFAGLSTWGPAFEGLYVLPAVIGGFVLGAVVDALVRYSAGGRARTRRGQSEVASSMGEGRGDSDRARAGLALEMFARRAAASVAAAARALRRFDALAFTGGIGEHSAAIRAAIVRRLCVET